MWSHLRSRQLADLKFRRQYPIGPYVCDFYCSKANLIVEIDGLVHETRAERDTARDEWMKEQGLRTLRISPSWIAKDLDAVLAMIVAEATQNKT